MVSCSIVPAASLTCCEGLVAEVLLRDQAHRVTDIWGGTMKLPRRKFLHLVAGTPGAGGLASRVLSLSDGRCASSFLSCRPGIRQRCAHGSIAVGRWAIIRHREPDRRRRQYRHRAAVHAAGRLRWCFPACRAHSTRRYKKLNFDFVKAPVASISGGYVMVVNPSVPRRSRNSSPTPKTIRARSTWHRPATGRYQFGDIQDDGRC